MRRLALLTLLALATISAAEAASGTGSARSGPIVAVLDTGVSLSDARLLAGVDLVDGDASPADPNGHGTAVATAVVSACESCRILPVRVLSSRGTAPWSRVAAGIRWAVDQGATVVNVSISGPTGSAELRRAIRYAAANDVLVVAAAGNAGDALPQYPAAYEGVVAVAAADGSGRLHDWSSRGSWVDLAAPGCSALPVAQRTALACGTSFAAPRAAGAAGAARAAEPAASAAAVAARLPRLVDPTAPAPHVTVAGTPRPGATVHATVTGASTRGVTVRWFRCAAGAATHDCTPVSAGGTYKVRAGDRGATLVARAVTQPFGGLWAAAGDPLPVG